MLNRKVVAIDGLSATGKSSLAKALAKKINFIHLSTGAIYRAVAYITTLDNISFQNQELIVANLKNHQLKLILQDSSARMIVDGSDITHLLYSPRNSELTSIVSSYSKVREALRDVQRNAFEGENIVVEGRDMGSVIFPDADIKFFIKVDTEIKIKRRIKQLSEGKNLTREEFEKLSNEMRIEIIERDVRDENRNVAPTIPAKDAIIIDNSCDGIEGTINNMVDIIKNHHAL